MSFSPVGLPTPESVRELFDGFNKIKVLVIGDSMIDTYLNGSVDRMSPEAPVPVLNVQEETHRLGGAANVALNLQSLGAQATLASVVGTDHNAALFTNLLAESGLSSEHILRLNDRPTTQKKRVMSGPKHLLRMDYEVDHLISQEDSDHFFLSIQSLFSEIDLVIIEDYDKGLLNQRLIDQIKVAAKQNNIPVCVDPKFRNFKNYQGVDFLKPNLVEFKAAIGKDRFHESQIDSLMKELREDMNISNLMLTLGSRGIVYDSNNHHQHFPVQERGVADVSGAGDTVMAIASLTLVIGSSPKIIAELSNLGGGIVCESPGVVPISKSRLLEEAVKALLL